MASSKEYLQFVLGQLSDLDEITYRAMMGEFIIYYRGKIIVKVGLADCGNGFSDTLWLFFTNFVLLFLSQWRFFLKCYTSLLLSLSFSLPDLLI